MRADEDVVGHAYYQRLAELLGCKMAGAYPLGFDPLVFESLWHFVRDWLAAKFDSRLALPIDSGTFRRIVALPLAHVPLRCLDVERMPDFFGWASYEAGAEIAIEQLSADFTRWLRSRTVLTPTGVAAFSDARRAAVLAQVAAELRSWDGSLQESISRRSAPVEILFDPVQHRPELFYLPRRPLGFPARFDDGMRMFESSADGWYARAAISSKDGEDLANGFSWHATSAGIEFALRRPGASIISLAPSDSYSYSGFMSARGLRRGVRCAVLCQEELTHIASEYLSHVTENTSAPVRHQYLPAGWSLFTGVLARRVAVPPKGLEAVEVRSAVDLIPSGGIRLGNRWAWLHGGAPRLFVSGSDPDLQVTVDGEAVVVGEDGMLELGRCLRSVGAHVVQIGLLRKTIEIVEPSLPSNLLERDILQSRPNAPVILTLPKGPWIVVGAVPGQVARGKYAALDNTIVTCDFKPSWAIRVGSGSGALALNVFAGVPPAPHVSYRERIAVLSNQSYREWTSTIYDAAVRHARIESLTSQADATAIRASWMSYARCAGNIKRAIRKGHAWLS
jgi:hypothetical protein